MKKLVFLTILLFMTLGFVYRLKGIIGNHSFWADESYIAYLAKYKPDSAFNTYQPFFVFLLSVSFKLFGISEFSARLPVIFFNSLGIVAAFFLALRLSNFGGGLLAAFLFSFSQLNLANATQAKPYSIIQVVVLTIIYLIQRLDSEKNNNTVRIHFLIILLIGIAGSLHYLGILSSLPYLTYVLLKNIKFNFKVLLLILLFIVILGIIALINRTLLFPYNHLVYFNELFFRQYLFFTVSAILGFLAVAGNNLKISVGVLILVVIYAYLWTFRQYTHNLRYLIPLFGIIFVYTGIFWSQAGEKIFKNSLLPCLLVIGILILGGYKIIRKPQVFYSPNADFFADVQIADYKSVFEKIKKIPNLNELFIANDYAEAQLFYLNGRGPDATFAKPHVYGIKSGESLVNGITEKRIYTTLDQFRKIRSENPKGLLIVEDWESILPEEIKQYAKKNLELEFRINRIAHTQEENWPIEVYSWGI